MDNGFLIPNPCPPGQYRGLTGGCGSFDPVTFQTQTAPSDPVNKPSHYLQGKIEVIDFIEDQSFGFLAGQVIKYVARYRFKNNPVEDLKKAEFYLKRLISLGGNDIGSKR